MALANDETAIQGVSTRDAVSAVGAGFLGWTLDAFDFFLVVISLPRIAADFHVKESVIAGSLTLTLMFRPLGVLIFGLLADRYGRRVPMMAAVIFYSLAAVATGLAPNLQVFLICRALFGIGMGGEWGVGMSLVMEKVSKKWRGLLSGFLQEGYAVGYLLAAVAAIFMLDRVGWRPMFFLGGAPALLALYIRFGIKESEVWQKSKAASWSNLGRTIGSHWKLWLYLTALMAMMNFSSHGTQDMFPTFMKSYRGLDPRDYSHVVIVMNVGAIGGGLLFGMLSNRFGRRAMMVVAFLGALAATPFWANASHIQTIIVSAFFMQFMVQGAWGVIPAHISELSPDQVRGFLPGFSYQCGNFIAASTGWIQLTLAEHYAYPRVMSFTAATIFVVAIGVTLAGKERRGRVFGQ